MTNEQVIAGLKAGDERVLKYIYDKYHGIYLSESFKLLQCREETLDVVMEAYIELWNKRTQFESVSSVNKFLAVCSVNKSLNILKHRGKANKHHEIIRDQLSHPEQPDLYQKLVLEQIAFISKRLSQKESELFTCEILHDIPTREIAKMMNVTMDTIRTMRYRINQKIAAMRPELQKAFY